MQIKLTRTLSVPDPVRVARYAHAPELGPKILFFSGGSALRSLSQEIIRYTHNSIHIITTFDSGGSSAELRRSFNMPAIGDIRNRLMSLADRTLHGNPAIFELFAFRFPGEADQEDLRERLDRMIRGKTRLVADIPDPMRKIIRNHLHQFRTYMPETFDLRHASIGNLVLAGGYLNNQRHLDPVIYIFSKLVQVRGVVRPVLNRHLHLIARLRDGTVIKEQHNLTGKEKPPIRSAVESIYLSRHTRKAIPFRGKLRDKTRKLIDQAELICYPMGSFYSSLIATLLPRGVGRAIGDNPCPKVFIPNTGFDPELFDTSLDDQVDALLRYLMQDTSGAVSPRRFLDMIIIDRKNGLYNGTLDLRKMKRLGIMVIDVDLVSSSSSPHIDEKLLIPLLLTLA